MGSITDIQEARKEHEAAAYLNTAITCAALLALDDITQEINITLGRWAEGTGKADRQKALIKIRDTLGPDFFYKLSELCDLHGRNLQNIAKELKRTSPDPDDDRKRTLKEELNSKPSEYQKKRKAIIDQYIDKIIGNLQ